MWWYYIPIAYFNICLYGSGAFLKVPFKYFLVLHSTSILKCSIRVTIYANRVVTNRVPMCTI